MAATVRTVCGIVGLALLIAGCGGTDDDCTELDCEHSLRIDFSPPLSGPYDLVVRGDNGMLTARCLDPDALETMDNPPELTCDGVGFSLAGGDLANERSLLITIIDVESGTELASAAEVRPTILEEHTPNGPSCPPTCFDRSGALGL